MSAFKVVSVLQDSLKASISSQELNLDTIDLGGAKTLGKAAARYA